MRTISITVALIILSSLCYGGETFRYSVENAEHFAERYKRDGEEIAFNVIEKNWNGRNSIVAFYKKTLPLAANASSPLKSSSIIYGRVYLQTTDYNYSEIEIDAFEPSDAEPQITDIGFLNADPDRENELIVVVSWEQNTGDLKGVLYRVFVYDDVKDSATRKLSYIRNMSDRFGIGCDGRARDGSRSKAKFKTINDIRLELKRLKFRQFYD